MAEPTAQDIKPAEPSMEEILASIRRIISEEPPAEEAAPQPDSAPPQEILNLTQMLKDDGSVVDVSKESGEAKKMEIALEDEPEIEQSIPEPSPRRIEEAPSDLPSMGSPEENAAADKSLTEDSMPASAPDPLLSAMVAERTASSLQRLTEKLESDRMPTMMGLPLGDGSRTLESMVMDIIRPMLKEWLEQNLPNLVEQIVQREIARLTRRD